MKIRISHQYHFSKEEFKFCLFCIGYDRESEYQYKNIRLWGICPIITIVILGIEIEISFKAEALKE